LVLFVLQIVTLKSELQLKDRQLASLREQLQDAKQSAAGGNLVVLAAAAGRPATASRPATAVASKQTICVSCTAGYLSFGPIEEYYEFCNLCVREKDWCSRACGAKAT
jgi:hypothetical protein